MRSPRRPPPKPMTTVAKQFVTAHLGRDAFAPFTGTDGRAWSAYVYLLELWGVSRDPRSVVAMRECIACAQPSTMDIFIQTIPAVLDWCHVRELWPRIKPAEASRHLAAVDCDDHGRVVRSYPGLTIIGDCLVDPK